jgi:hypothetical protein
MMIYLSALNTGSDTMQFLYTVLSAALAGERAALATQATALATVQRAAQDNAMRQQKPANVGIIQRTVH